MEREGGLRLAWVDPCYKGTLLVQANLYKNKWTAGISVMFGRYTRRFFVLDIQNRTFSYYSDYTCRNGAVYGFNVSPSIVYCE